MSVKEKARLTGQVCIQEMNVNEPLMKCRNGRNDVKTGTCR